MPHPQLSFRPVPALSKKELLAFHKDAGWKGPQQVALPQDPRGQVQWVSVMSGKASVGVARLELAPPEFCYIADLIIASPYRGQGVGHWFIEQIERYCVNFGVRRLLLQAATGTGTFYESLRFVKDPNVPNFLKKEINPFQRKLFVG